jgi:L-arabinose transport system substrate-binding protein
LQPGKAASQHNANLRVDFSGEFTMRSLNTSRRLALVFILVGLLLIALPLSVSGQDDEITIGYIVKHLDNPWFVSETGGAQELADAMGVELLIQDVQFDSALAMSTLDTYIGSGVDGIIIVVPEQMIGPAVLERAAEAGIPVIAVDDEIQDAAGNPAPFAGFNAAAIGQQVGTVAVQEFRDRGWDSVDGRVGVFNIEFANLDVCTARTDATTQTWQEQMPEFLTEQMILAPYDGTLINATDTFSSIITANPDITHFVLYSCNDDGVMGAVRALEQAGVPAENIIGVGLGAHLACDEWAKDEPSGFSSAIFIDAANHGRFAVANMVNHLRYDVPLPAFTYAPGLVVTRDDHEILNCGA